MATMKSFDIKHIQSTEDLKDAISLFEQYAKSLKIDLSFQDFANEMASMPGKYAPPSGCLLLARNKDAGAAIGCVGLRGLETHAICEMKRLYVDPIGRGLGVGRALAVAVIEEAKRLGYTAMRLDTLSSMESAKGLYKALGFKEIGSYYETPIEGTVFLELSLEN